MKDIAIFPVLFKIRDTVCVYMYSYVHLKKVHARLFLHLQSGHLVFAQWPSKRKGEGEKVLSEGNFAIKRRNAHELATDTFIKTTLTHAHNGYKGKVEKS